MQYALPKIKDGQDKLYIIKTSYTGFTLIELLIVIAIIGVLAAAILLAIDPLTQLKKARDARRKADLRQITTLLKAYYTVNGQYPPAGACPLGQNCYVFSVVSGNGPGGANWIPALMQDGDAKALPLDPLNNAGTNNSTALWNPGYYGYGYGNVSANGQAYDLFTQLEYSADPDRCELKQYTYGAGIWSTPDQWCGCCSKQMYEMYQ